MTPSISISYISLFLFLINMTTYTECDLALCIKCKNIENLYFSDKCTDEKQRKTVQLIMNSHKHGGAPKLLKTTDGDAKEASHEILTAKFASEYIDVQCVINIESELTHYH